MGIMGFLDHIFVGPSRVTNAVCLDYLTGTGSPKSQGTYTAVPMATGNEHAQLDFCLSKGGTTTGDSG